MSHVAVAISGGVDSLLAVYLLKNQGLQVTGIHFLTGFESLPVQGSSRHTGCLHASRASQKGPSPQAAVLQLADQLEIDMHVLDCRKAFKRCVVDYFKQAYASGKTPNPCLVCNPLIKFGAVWDFAKRSGATHLATGHYAQIRLEADGKYHLFRGVDRRKDQSYFLSFLSQRQLSRALFPLGSMTKKEVKKMAASSGLRPAVKTESQDICFIHDRSYVEFLTSHCGLQSTPGVIENVRGQVVGKHEGLHRYTVGQRRGINCPAPEPYYVVRLDMERNRLVVGSQKDLLVGRFQVSKINWIGGGPAEPVQAFVRVRYRHTAVPATIYPQGTDRCEVVLQEPERAVTPGQGAVFYVGDEVLGGGFIDG